MSKLLVLPDIHGRKFWEEPCKHIDNYDKVIFLGDYLDPYGFESISVETAMDNFQNIIDFKRKNNDKVVLLLGNHDMPYFSTDYFNFSSYHCRHSSMYHREISNKFAENKDLFHISFVYEDILFTHAGVESGWLYKVVHCEETDINKISDTLNSLLDDKEGMKKLFCITENRGGRSRYGSCIWSDVHDMMWDTDKIKNALAIVFPIHKIKQVFGHTLQAFYDLNRNIAYGDALEFGNRKMIDTADAYELNVDDFTINKCLTT